MAFTCVYAASGKNAGSAVDASPVTTACHSNCIRARNDASVPDGRAVVCGSVPGSTVVDVVVGAGVVDVAGDVDAGDVVTTGLRALEGAAGCEEEQAASRTSTASRLR